MIFFFRGAIVENEFRPQPRSRERELVPATAREHRTAFSIRIYHAAEGFFSSLVVSGCSVPVIVLLSMTSLPKAPGHSAKVVEKAGDCRPAPDVEMSVISSKS